MFISPILSGYYQNICAKLNAILEASNANETAVQTSSHINPNKHQLQQALMKQQCREPNKFI